MNISNIVVIGAGFWGCTIARLFANYGTKVNIIEKRSTIGGNAYSYIDSESGIEIHKYGPHVFHTSSYDVLDFINKFTTLFSYNHKQLAYHNGKMYFLPIGLSLINQFFNVQLSPQDVDKFLTKDKYQKIFDVFFKNYTFKQWGYNLEEIDKNILKRIPIRYNYDLNYFNDYNVGIPLNGYTDLFNKILNHQNIKIVLNKEFSLNDLNQIDKNILVFFSGPLDRLFKYKFGKLQWRTVDIKFETINIKDLQGTSVVNYVDSDVPYTRVCEYKHFRPDLLKNMMLNKTIISKEYPRECNLNDEPFYPINSKINTDIYVKYVNESKKYQNLIIGGRLGSYKYLDMDKTIKQAIDIFKQICVKK